MSDKIMCFLFNEDLSGVLMLAGPGKLHYGPVVLERPDDSTPLAVAASEFFLREVFYDVPTRTWVYAALLELTVDERIFAMGAVASNPLCEVVVQQRMALGDPKAQASATLVHSMITRDVAASRYLLDPRLGWLLPMVAEQVKLGPSVAIPFKVLK